MLLLELTSGVLLTPHCSESPGAAARPCPYPLDRPHAAADLGLRNATDLDGGFRAGKAAGLPVA